MAEQDVLRLVFEVVDKASAPIAEVKKSLAGLKGPDSKTMVGQFEQVRSAIQAATAAINGSSGFNAAIQGATGLITGPGGLIAGASALITVAGGITAVAIRFATAYRELKNLSTETGVSVRNLRAMQAAGRHFGIEPEQMTSMLGHISRQMWLLRQRRGEWAQFLTQQMFVPGFESWRTFFHELRGAGSTEEAFGKIVVFLRSIRNEQERQFVAERLLGDARAARFARDQKWNELNLWYQRHFKELTEAQKKDAELIADTYDKWRTVLTDVGPIVRSYILPFVADAARAIHAMVGDTEAWKELLTKSDSLWGEMAKRTHDMVEDWQKIKEIVFGLHWFEKTGPQKESSTGGYTVQQWRNVLRKYGLEELGGYSSFGNRFGQWQQGPQGGTMPAPQLQGYRPGGGAAIERGAVTQQIVARLRGEGMPDTGIAAVLGTFQQESSLNPNLTNRTGHRGLAQWEPARYPRDWSTGGQLSHFVDEMRRQYPSEWRTLLDPNASDEQKMAAMNRYERFKGWQLGRHGIEAGKRYEYQDAFKKFLAAGPDLAYVMSRGGHSTGAGAPGTDPELVARMAAAGRAYESGTGLRARFGEMDRDYETQRHYWIASGFGRRYAAAPPGRSRHNVGEAADVPSGPFRNWLYQYGRGYGLHFPVRGDKPHMQMDPSFRRSLINEVRAGAEAANRPTAATFAERFAPADEMMRNAANAGVLSRAQRFEGDARLRIDLNGFPQGTKTWFDDGGMFKETTINRGRTTTLSNTEE